MLRLCCRIALLLPALLYLACQSNTPEPAGAGAPPLAVDSLTGTPTSLPNPWKNAGCELVTDEEIKALFGIEVKRDVFNARTLADQGFCLRTWMKPDWKERESGNEKPGAQYLEFKNTLVTQVLDYGTETISRAQFDMVRRDQANVYTEAITGLGDGALWSNSQLSLMVKKGHLVIKITLDYADQPHDNLDKARAVARLALAKMR
ncbi:MAG: hypothetical protein IT260_09580 [Saprospiraceae bacterium]|nr:hypothetical protein [Saprospiraceae bacterium]